MTPYGYRVSSYVDLCKIVCLVGVGKRCEVQRFVREVLWNDCWVR